MSMTETAPIVNPTAPAAPDTRTPWQIFCDEIEDNGVASWAEWYDRLAAFHAREAGLVEVPA